MGQWLIRIANAALFTLCCYQGASVVNQVAAGALAPEVAPAQISVPAAQASSPGWNERKVIVDRNLFGSSLEGVDTIDLEPIDDDVTPSNLPLRLLGTLASTDEAIASAAIENKSNRKSRVYKLDQSIDGFPDVTLEIVDRKRVVLRNGGKREQLSLDEDAPQKVAAKPRPSRRERRRASRGSAGSRLADRLKEIQTKGGGRTAAELFSQAKVIPKYDDGVMVGVELNSIVEGSLYEKLGLADGDVITELNGIEINNAGASAKALQALSQEDEISITVGGEVRTFSAADLEGLLP